MAGSEENQSDDCSCDWGWLTCELGIVIPKIPGKIDEMSVH